MNKEKIKLFDSIKMRVSQPECVLVFDPQRDLFYEFNSTGSELIMEIKNGKSDQDIIRFISGKYHIEQEIVKKELAAFYKKLVKLGIAYQSK